jgi:HEAT repeat protein
VTLLGQLGDRRSAMILVGALKAGLYSRSRIATALDAFDIDLGDLIASLLEAPGADVRLWGVTLMQRYPQTPALAERLAALTTDGDPLVRKSAVVAISATGAATASSAVRARLTDKVGFVRAHAARALAQLEGTTASRALLPLLADRDWTVRNSAKQSLGAMGTTVTHAVLSLLTHADLFARNSAAEVLQNIGVFERLLTQELEGATELERVRTLRLLAHAGGPAMVAGVIDRIKPDLRPRARQLLAPRERKHPITKEVA